MPSATDPSANGGKLGWVLLHFFLGAISVPLLGAFWVEFIWLWYGKLSSTNGRR